jgi:hypothetical protein
VLRFSGKFRVLPFSRKSESLSRCRTIRTGKRAITHRRDHCIVPNSPGIATPPDAFHELFRVAQAMHRTLPASIQSGLWTTASDAMENLEVAQIFDEVADLSDSQSVNPFRVRA